MAEVRETLSGGAVKNARGVSPEPKLMRGCWGGARGRAHAEPS